MIGTKKLIMEKEIKTQTKILEKSKSKLFIFIMTKNIFKPILKTYLNSKISTIFVLK